MNDRPYYVPNRFIAIMSQLDRFFPRLLSLSTTNKRDTAHSDTHSSCCITVGWPHNFQQEYLSRSMFYEIQLALRVAAIAQYLPPGQFLSARVFRGTLARVELHARFWVKST